MRKLTFITVVALLAALFAAPAMAMTLTSSSFKDGGAIGMKYVCPANDVWPEGKNVSPQLAFSSLPAETRCIVVVMEDKTLEDKKVKTFSCHWAFAAKIDEKGGSIDEGADLASSGKYHIFEADYPMFADAKNGYAGPFPPKEGELSGTHEYRFTAYALKTSSVLDFTKSISENIEAVKTNAIGQASITGKFPYDEPQEEVWKLAGTWNYTATIPESTVTIQGVEATLKAEEKGTILATMTTGEKEGREYYDYLTLSSTGTVTINGKSYTASVKDEKIKLENKLYTPGDDITYTYETKDAEGNVFKEEIVCKQVEENKITGKLYLSMNGTKIAEGDITATRPTGSSSSSGGCNAGATAAMLLFCALPMICRKKK